MFPARVPDAEIINYLHGGVPLPTVPGPGEVQRRRVNVTALMFIRQWRTVPLRPGARGRLGGDHQPPSPPWGKG